MYMHCGKSLNLGNKLLTEFSDVSRGNFAFETWFDGSGEVIKGKIITLTWHPNTDSYKFLKSCHGARILKMAMVGYPKVGNQYIYPEKKPYKSGKEKKNGYGSIWKQKCYFDDENTTISVIATVPLKMLNYGQENNIDHSYKLTAQRIKLILTVPISSRDIPLIKPATNVGKQRLKQRKQALRDIPQPHAPQGGGAIKVVTHVFCRIASMNGSKTIYDMQPFRDGKGSEAPVIGSTHDYRIYHNIVRGNKKFPKIK